MGSSHLLWVAQDRGFLAKYGIEANLVFISSGSLNVQGWSVILFSSPTAVPPHWKRGCAARS
ncbi:MAG TPA: hypothetical protein VF089_02695 [Candidatus Binatia bacterium]